MWIKKTAPLKFIAVGMTRSLLIIQSAYKQLNNTCETIKCYIKFTFESVSWNDECD